MRDLVSKRILSMLGVAVLVCFMATARPVEAADTLLVGSDVGIPPGEFYAGHPRRLMGFDVDLIAAIGAKMHRRVTIVPHPFKTLLPAVASGAFDLGMSSITDTTVRERSVDFVDYLIAGTGMLVKSGNPQRLFSLSSLCGKAVPYEIRTIQESYVRGASQQCTRLHLGAIDTLPSVTMNQAIAKLTSGQAVTFIRDYPTVAYLARTLGNGRSYQVAARQFFVQPFGIVVSKRNPALRDDVQHALAAVIADGTYDALIQKWGLEQGAMRSAPINVGGLFE